MARCPTPAVLPLVALAAEKVIRHRYKGVQDAGAGLLDRPPWTHRGAGLPRAAGVALVLLGAHNDTAREGGVAKRGRKPKVKSVLAAQCVQNKTRSAAT
ncbi:MAG: hypothetical protein ACQESR_05505 [Planctomycetota bacterium]